MITLKRITINGKKGFTLVETMIAVAILVSVLGALTYTISQSLRLARTTASRDIALNAAQKKLEEIANSNLHQILDYSGQTFAVAGLQRANAPDDPGEVSVVAVSGTADLFDVTVAVNWQQAGAGELSKTLSTTMVVK